LSQRRFIVVVIVSETDKLLGINPRV